MQCLSARFNFLFIFGVIVYPDVYLLTVIYYLSDTVRGSLKRNEVIRSTPRYY